MNQNIKNALGAVGVLAIIVASAAAWNWASAISRSTTSGATFSVSGEGKMIGIPDVAQFGFKVENEGGKDIAATQKENTTKTNAAIEYLKSQGVDAKDIETEDYSVSPRYESYSCPPVVYYEGPTNASSAVAPIKTCPSPVVIGYTITQAVQVKVRDFSKVGDILSGIVSKGANSVSGLTFIVDDASSLENEARSKAIEQAKTHAEAIAKAGGFKLGRLIAVDDYSSNPYNPEFVSYTKDAAMANVGGAVPPSPVIEPGSRQIMKSVTLTYEIR